MSIDSVQTLLTILHRAQVLTPQEVQEVAQELGPHFANPCDLARYLKDINWLTEYQVRLLFNDRWQDLTIGPYLIIDRIGEGGVSEVFKAWDTGKGQIVALKVLHQHLTDHSAAVRELQRELRAVTRLSHANIIRTYDASQVGDVCYFAMEFVEGLDFDRYVHRFGPLPIAEACEYIRQVAQGLQHAHQLGLVHRDIKPANLFLSVPGGIRKGDSSFDWRTADSVVKILDWGLARMRLDGPLALRPSLAGVAIAEMAAEKGKLIGTADYSAPEQSLDPSLVDIRADVYSLGCTLYFLLAGQPPFPGGSLMQKILQHQSAERPNLREVRPDVPEEVAAVVRRMMACDPEERYAIPLLAAGALRPFAAAAARPGSSPNLVRPKKPSTAIINIAAIRKSASAT